MHYCWAYNVTSASCTADRLKECGGGTSGSLIGSALISRSRKIPQSYKQLISLDWLVNIDIITWTTSVSSADFKEHLKRVFVFTESIASAKLFEEEVLKIPRFKFELHVTLSVCFYKYKIHDTFQLIYLWYNFFILLLLYSFPLDFILVNTVHKHSRQIEEDISGLKFLK